VSAPRTRRARLRLAGAAFLAAAAALGLGAREAPAQVAVPWSVAQLASDDTRAGQTTTWHLTLKPPSIQPVGPPEIPRIMIFMPGAYGGQAGFGLTSPTPPVTITGGPGSVPTFLNVASVGDPTTGVTIIIRYERADMWTDTTTLHIAGIVNAATALNFPVTVQLDRLQFFAPFDTLRSQVVAPVRPSSVTQVRVFQPVPSGYDPIHTQTAGVPFPVIVEALDRFGNQSDTSCTLLAVDSTGTLPMQPVGLTTGVGSIPNAVVTLAVPTDYIQVTDGFHTGRSNSFAVLPGPLDHLYFRPPPVRVIANHPFAGRVEARDAYDNVADFNGTASAADVGGQLTPSSLSFAAGVWAGLFTVPDPLSLDSILVFASGKLVTSTRFQVAAQTFASFQLTLPPGPRTAGFPFLLMVRAVDDSGYTFHAYTAPVFLGDSLPGARDSLFTPGQTGFFTGGVWADSARCTRAGTGHRIYVQDAAHHLWYSAPFDVLPGPTTRLVLSGYPASAEVHRAFPLVITATDAFNNTTPAAAGPAVLDDKKHRVSPTTTTAFANGVWRGTVTVADTTAYDVITATYGAASGSSRPIQVVVPQVASFTVGGGGAVRTAGQAFAVSLQALDSFGDPDPYFIGSVQLNDDSGTLSPTSSGPFAAGTLTVFCTVTKSGPDRIHADDLNLHTGQSGTFTVTPAAHQGFDFAAIGPQKAHVAFILSLQAVDVYHNLVDTFAGQAGLTDATGTLSLTQTGAFSGGLWSGSVTVGHGYPADRVFATYGNLPTSPSNVFVVDAATPRIAKVQPSWIPPGGAAAVTVTGTNFESDAALSVQSDVAVSGVTVTGTDTLRGVFSVSPGAALGFRPVTVSQFHASASDTSFQIAQPRVRPAALARTAQQRPVTITGIVLEFGTHYDLGPGVNSLGVVPHLARPDSLTVNVTVDSAAALGGRSLSTVTSRGVAFSFPALTVMPRPVVTALDPDSASYEVAVAVQGTGFDPAAAAGDSVSIGGRTLPAVVADSGTTSFVVPDSLDPGLQRVAVSAFGAWSAGVPFWVLQPERGDVNGDGRATLADVAIAADAILGRRALGRREAYAADCDGSGTVDVVDLAVQQVAPGAPAPDADPGRGTATWNAAARVLRLPAEARAVEWRAAGEPGEGVDRNAGAAQAWRAAGGSLVGVAVVPASHEVRLPDAARTLLAVRWADGSGRVFRADLAAPSPPARFAVLGNPQRGALWFAVPPHAGEAVLELFDAAGRRVAGRALGPLEAGQVSLSPPARLAAGLYLVRFRAGAAEARGKLIYLP